ncbi:MAG TPA: hypothetical protein VIG85_10065 [Comamonas sp.]
MIPATLRSLGSTLAGACILTCIPLATWAQQAYGTVLEATPIYEEVAIPQEECTEFAKQKRCETSTTYEEKLVGYDVLYEYNGQQHAQRMAHKPGKRIPIQAATSPHSYGSAERTSASVATPGKKSYGSIGPGTPEIESIQYQNDAPDPLINLDLRVGQPPHPRR